MQLIIERVTPEEVEKLWLYYEIERYMDEMFAESEQELEHEN